MPRERLPMRKISDVLRLPAGGLSKRRIAVSLNIGRRAVGDYINRFSDCAMRQMKRGATCPGKISFFYSFAALTVNPQSVPLVWGIHTVFRTAII